MSGWRHILLVNFFCEISINDYKILPDIHLGIEGVYTRAIKRANFINSLIVMTMLDKFEIILSAWLFSEHNYTNFLYPIGGNPGDRDTPIGEVLQGCCAP